MSSNAKNGQVTLSSNGEIAVGARYSARLEPSNDVAPSSNAPQVTPQVTLWRYIGLEPCQRKDGTWTHLKLWARECRTCGAEFVAKTPQGVALECWTGKGGSKVFSLVNCEAHRGLGLEHAGGRLLEASRTRAFAEVPA
jgi:hypothetical protein